MMTMNDMIIPVLTRGYHHGRYVNHSTCNSNHLRPLDYNFSIAGFKRYVWLDNVEPCMGTGINTSDIRDIQLPFSKNERKE